MFNEEIVVILAHIYQRKINAFYKSDSGQKQFFTLQICGKTFSVVIKRPWCLWILILRLTLRLVDDDHGMYSRPEHSSELKGSEFLLWMNYVTLSRLKQLFSPVLYIYWDTWKAAAINHVEFHIPRHSTWFLRFWTSVAPCEVFQSEQE